MKRRRDRSIIFPDYPDFQPNLTPAEMFSLGVFGGTYWRPIYSAVTRRKYVGEHKKYSFLKGIDPALLCSTTCDISRNRYGVHSGTSLEYWESNGWIKPQDPYGWVQWYCEFFAGRRSPDDARQIARWRAFAGPSGRFLRRLVNMIKNAKTTYDDDRVSPVIRQGLLHWGKILTKYDLQRQD